jgi:hypothetical protein
MTVPSDPGVPRRANRLVRPYVLTAGRTATPGVDLELDTTIRATVEPVARDRRAAPEIRRIVDLCRKPMPLAEVAGRVVLPVGVVRVLVGDLVAAGSVSVQRAAPADAATDPRVLKKLLHGIRAL